MQKIFCDLFWCLQNIFYLCTVKTIYLRNKITNNSKQKQVKMEKSAEKKPNFWQMYAEAKACPPPPTEAKEFVRKVSEAAQRSEHTVRMWLAQAQPIEPLAKKPIAQVLLGREDVTPEDINSLFNF